MDAYDRFCLAIGEGCDPFHADAYAHRAINFRAPHIEEDDSALGSESHRQSCSRELDGANAALAPETSLNTTGENQAEGGATLCHSEYLTP